MRLIFSLAGLLVAVVAVMLLARHQLQAVRLPVGAAASSPLISGTPAQQSQALQRQVGDDVQKALEQGMRRNAAEADKQP